MRVFVSTVAFCLVAIASATSADDSATIKLNEATKFSFATVEQGRAALLREDAFTRNLSRFDLESRLQTSDQATRETWQKLVAAQVRAWEPKDRARLAEVVSRLRDRLVALKLPLPAEILLIHTTGKEEGEAAYCRGAAIVLPDKVLAYADDKLDRLLVHELFHVLSNQNPELRAQLYSLVGFHVMREIELPPSLRERRITNPDAPAIDSWIELEADGKQVPAAPILYASAERYDPARARSFFEYLVFRLMVLEEKEGVFSPVLKDGEPVLLDPKATPSYFAQIGRNTQYIIHPDEILADNFVHLVLETKNIATPRIVEDLRRELSK